MLTVYRSNRAELLAQVLATNLQLQPPPPLEQIQVVVNTWPTSRWLGEQIALGNGCGIAANLRFPFPSSLLRRLVEELLQEAEGASQNGSAEGPDLWRAQNLVWPLLDLLPDLLSDPAALPLRQWLERRDREGLSRLDPPLWQLARAIADALDDYGLYRPALLEAWLAGESCDAAGQPLNPALAWQPLLVRRLLERIGQRPFGLRARQLIQRLQQGWRPQQAPGEPLRLFGLSSLAPVQVELLQALSGWRAVELYLLTPCRDLWQRREPSRLQAPLDAHWLLEVPGLEARFGRLGAEFQQLLEGSGDTQLGQWREGDLFFAPASVARSQGRPPSLLEQLQERLAGGSDGSAPLEPAPDDRSLEFHACPGRLRQLQIVRDRLLQLLAEDRELEPRDILVMTPQVEAFAPLVGAVFGDSEATGVVLPWRLTDRSQQSEAGIAQGLLQLLQLGGERLTASAVEALLTCAPLLQAQGIAAEEAGAITALLQQAGFRWGLDGRERGGDPCHSLRWALDRLLLGLVLPERPGLAPADTAPLVMPGSLEQQGRWLQLLRLLCSTLEWLRQSRTPAGWVEGLRPQLSSLFGEGGERAWELQAIHAALADWRAVAGDSPLELPAAVVAEVLSERLSEGSGRFGHRSGALTISALEPMRAIPHKVVVLMGLDAGSFPRQRQRPGFHLLEQQRLLGDPNSSDQDRYVLLESLLSARQHLLVSWSCRDERTGERLEASTPVRQWLELLRQQLGEQASALPLREHAANPLERSNFLPQGTWPPASCDQRLLQARRQLEQQRSTSTSASAPASQRGLAFSTPAAEPPASAATPSQRWSDLLAWIEAPQRCWLESLGLRPQEFDDPVLDLEPLTLDERQRSALLRRELDLEPGGPAPDWAELERGRGSLPPLAAGALEVRQLQERWHSLHRCLEQLGPAQERTIEGQGLEGQQCWRGNLLLRLHPGKPRAAQRLGLWLELLLACSSGQSPEAALLVGRDGDQFRVLERLQTPSAAEARTLLEQLQQWRSRHRSVCWPLPPQTGWSFAKAEQSKPGQGWGKAQACWEGSFQQRAERSEAIQALCFGADLPFAELFGPSCQELALQLHGPLLACWQEQKR